MNGDKGGKTINRPQFNSIRACANATLQSDHMKDFWSKPTNSQNGGKAVEKLRTCGDRRSFSW